MTDHNDSISALLRRLAAAVREEYDIIPIDVEIRAEGTARPLSLPFPRGGPIDARNASERDTVLEVGDEEPPKVTRTERRILKAIEAMNGDAPTGEEVAAAAKLPCESNLRKTLAAMRLKGLLGGEKGEPGYPITTLGLEVIEPEN